MYQYNVQGAPTLATIWREYQATRKLRPATLRGYKYRINKYLKDWHDLPITEIDKFSIEIRHREIVQQTKGDGAVVANQTMRMLKALINFGIQKYDLPMRNPVEYLNALRLWHREKVRQDYITPAEMPAFVRTVCYWRHRDYAECLMFLLLTGLRHQEISLMTWEMCDLGNGWLRLPNTKNHQPHTIPLSDVALRILQVRRAVQDTARVFPMRLHARDYGKVSQACGVYFYPHSLRRTYATVADGIGMEWSTIARLLNHKLRGVTASYIVTDPNRLRAPQQAITDEVLRQAGVSKQELLNGVLYLAQPP